jgi:hypothetical protein
MMYLCCALASPVLRSDYVRTGSDRKQVKLSASVQLNARTSIGGFFTENRKRTIFGAPCKGTVFQRVRIPPGNSRSSR